MSAGRRCNGHSRLILPALLFLNILTGCASTFDSTTLGVPVTMATAAGQTPAGSPFRLTSRAVFAFWGLARIKEPSIRKALAAELAGASGIANVKIKVRSRWNDVLVTILTAGLLVPRAVTFEGVILK